MIFQGTGKLAGLVAVGIGVLLSSWSLFAQEEKAESQDSSESKQESQDSASSEFDERLEEWKSLLVDLRSLRYQYRSAETEREQNNLRGEYETLLEKGKELAPILRKDALKAYTDAKTKDRDIERFLASEAQYHFQNDQYETAAEIAPKLAEGGYDNANAFTLAGESLIQTNQYEEAKPFLEKAKEYEVLRSQSEAFLEEFDRYLERWQAELSIREAEAKADDLPRVKFETTKGDVIIELFENEAPNTVANFITLVESGFYDGLPFHRVLQGFMAQGGDPNGDGTGGPGYQIPSECLKENRRNHFRGSLSMANAGLDTGGSQFFICYVITDHLDGRHTVFGRVIEGLENASKLTYIDPSKESTATPDRILKAEVLRKREHEYKVNKVGMETEGPAEEDASTKEETEEASADAEMKEDAAKAETPKTEEEKKSEATESSEASEKKADSSTEEKADNSEEKAESEEDSESEDSETE
ncbi:Peptidyl-prolyl cis-trans isomerase B [Planctomycetales bacterium 10988]|nr:Peptidyl-prolyl cis-trans isomerase B [Planctomycetales bacterium 10988]